MNLNLHRIQLKLIRSDFTVFVDELLEFFLSKNLEYWLFKAFININLMELNIFFTPTFEKHLKKCIISSIFYPFISNKQPCLYLLYIYIMFGAGMIKNIFLNSSFPRLLHILTLFSLFHFCCCCVKGYIKA